MAESIDTDESEFFGLQILQQAEVILLQSIFVFGVIFRASVLESAYSAHRDCYFCFFWQALQHDCLILGPAIFLSWASFSAYFLLRVISRVGLIFLATAYFVDIVVFVTFAHQRLLIESAMRFLNMFDWIRFVMSPEKASLFLIYFALFGVVVICVLRHRPKKNRHMTFGSIFFGAAFTTLGIFPSRFEDPLADKVRNVFEVNRNHGWSINYSDKFRAEILSNNHQGQLAPRVGLFQRRNVVLVILESVSSAHSRFFSGLNDFTPHLDAIAKDHRAYVNFYANSFASRPGRRAIMTGTFALPSSEQRLAPESLVSIFKHNGFKTSAFYACSPNVDGLGSWITTLGIDHFSSSIDPFYATDTRGVFNSVRDDRLYENVLQYLKREGSSELQFITILTASSHQPFRNPVTQESGIAAAVRYADEALGRFYKKLLEAHYFDHGILIITSDHHAMTPVSDAERDRFGGAAGSMIPLVLVESSEASPQIIDTAFQQADLLSTMDYYLGQRYCQSPWRGNLLTGEPAKCIFHISADATDQVELFCNKEYATVRLDGDRTQIVSGNISDPAVLWRLHLERLGSAPALECASDSKRK